MVVTGEERRGSVGERRGEERRGGERGRGVYSTVEW
jgi:hypothetical protein